MGIIAMWLEIQYMKPRSRKTCGHLESKSGIHTMDGGNPAPAGNYWDSYATL